MLLEDCWSVKIRVTSLVDLAVAMEFKTSLRCSVCQKTEEYEVESLVELIDAY